MSSFQPVNLRTIKFLFWNIHKNPDNITRILKLATEREVHVIALCEATDITSIMIDKSSYRKIDYINQSDSHNIELLVNKSATETINYYTEKRRYNIVYLHEWNIILAIAHLNSDRTTGAKDYRASDISNMLKAIERLENDLKTKRTIVIGDLNIGLFDEQMLAFSGLNARLFLSEMKMYSCLHEDKKDCFYNPMLNIYQDSENDSIANGTYYYDGAPEKWCCYDHVMMKLPLVDQLIKNKLEIISSIGTEQLIKNSKPVQSISDHLPIYFEINEQGGNNNV